MPRVSIVMPLFNDEEWVAHALESCLNQTLTDIEVICIDDVSTDGTCGIVEEFQQKDPRIRLIRQEVNRSAFQARRVGIAAATAPYVLFLDGDDELAPRAAELAVGLATGSGADLVGLGVEIVVDDGHGAPRFERTLQPAHDELLAPDIVPSLFPVGEPAQGHLWRYLFATALLRGAYEGFADDLTIYRANDLPITFLALARATKYVSTKERLYRYAFRRGTSGHQIRDLGDFHFYLGAVDSIDAIDGRVRDLAGTRDAPLVASYESARLSIIGNLLLYCVQKAADEVRVACLGLLEEKVGATDVVRAAATFFPEALPLIAVHLDAETGLRHPVRNVLLTTGNLRTGGVQGVVVAQAKYLIRAGFTVTIALFSSDPVAYDLPKEVQLVRVAGRARRARVESWLAICRDNAIDLVIDHHILYNDYWPFHVLASRSLGVPTIGWMHNFALRPVFDLDDRTTFLTTYLPLLQQVVVLSATDVAYWKLRGIDHVAYLPNPPSPLLHDLPLRDTPKELSDGGPLEIVWWGRLQQSTKQVLDLIGVAAVLRQLEVDFRLTIIGPDGIDLNSGQLRGEAERNGVTAAVNLTGPLYGEDLVQALANAHVFVSTSVIEGYPLTLVEAQAMGLPVAMFDLPWLTVLKENEGVVTVAQGQIHELASRLAALARDPGEYMKRSAASLTATQHALAHDFSSLYSQLLDGVLPVEYSPEPTLADASLLLEWATFYSERNTRVARLAEERQTVLRRENVRLQSVYAASQRRLAATRGSWSFRFGRGATYLPRKARQLGGVVLDALRRSRMRGSL